MPPQQQTSLLDALSARSAYDSGTLTLDAQPANSSNLKRLKRKIAYIKQSDIFFDHLTVRDQLTYTALLRLPSRGRRNNPSDGQASTTAGMTKDEKIAEVNRILKTLRLTKCADTPIRLVSGGERKRVNIGTELLTDPSVIMLDEPTSGLDSTSAVALLSMLQELARTQRKTIITSIHQPSSSVFQRFDMLLLLADGCVVYFGSPVDSLAYLTDRGYACPPGYNAADHWMDLLVVDSALEGGTAISTSVTDTSTDVLVGPNGTTLCQDSTSSLEEFTENEAEKGHAGRRDASSDIDKTAAVGAIFKKSDVAIPDGAADEDDDAVSSKMTDVFNRKKATMRRRSSAIRLGRRQRVAAIAGSTPRARLIAAWNNDEFSDELDIAVEEEEAKMKEQGGIHQQDAATGAEAERKFNTSWFTQFSVLTHRCMKNSRSAIFTPLNIVKSVCLGVIVGLLWFQMPYTERTVVDRSSYFFFTMTYWVFESMFAALFSFPNERRVIFKERASGSYHLSAYFFAKTVSEAPTRLSLPALYMVISYWMAGANPRFDIFLASTLCCLLSVMAGESIGLLIGAVVMDFEKAMVIMVVFSLTLMVAGGYYVSNIPSFLTWIKYLSPFNYAYNASSQLVFDRPVPCDGSGVLAVYCGEDDSNGYVSPDQVLSFLGITGTVAFNAGCLIVIFILPRYVAFLALKRKKGAERS